MKRVLKTMVRWFATTVFSVLELTGIPKVPEDEPPKEPE